MKKLIIILFAIILAGGVFFTLKQLISKNNNNDIQKPAPAQTSFNFLLLGYGGGTHEGTYLTDTMMLAHVDTKTKKATLFSIPRDLWVRLPTKSGADFHIKINAVYQLELGDLGDVSKVYPDLDQSHFGKADDANFVKYILTQITNLPIDGYVGVDFSGFTKAVDILGGIDVNIEKSFTDTQYPIDGKEKDLCDKNTEELFKKAEPYITPPFDPAERLKKFKEDPKIEEFVKNATDSPELAYPCRYEKLEFKKGVAHMDGTTALKYARSRHSEINGGDFNRARRQQQIIEAVKSKVLSLGIVTKIPELINEFKQDVKTDISSDLITKFISLANTVNQYKITTYVLSDENVLQDAVSDDRQFILIPKEGLDKWNGIQKEIASLSGKLK